MVLVEAVSVTVGLVIVSWVHFIRPEQSWWSSFGWMVLFEGWYRLARSVSVIELELGFDCGHAGGA